MGQLVPFTEGWKAFNTPPYITIIHPPNTKHTTK